MANTLRELGLRCTRELAQAVIAESLETTQREFEEPMISRLVVIPARLIEALENGRFVTLGAHMKMGGRGDDLFHEPHLEIRSVSLLVNKDFYVLTEDSATLLRLRRVCGSDQDLAKTVSQLRCDIPIIDPARPFTTVRISPGVVDGEPVLLPRFTTTLADVLHLLPEPDVPFGYWVHRRHPYISESRGRRPEGPHPGYWQDKSCLDRVFGYENIVIDLIHEDDETVCLTPPEHPQIVAAPCECVFVVCRHTLY